MKKNRLASGQGFIDFGDELVVDNFAGGGGASLGIEMGIGRPVDIAINHDPEAIAMHKVNHPQTKHYCESVWDVDPREATKGRPVGLAWFSPDCKHFSKAKGSKPVNKNIRGLAWVVIRWAATVRPRVIMLENVEEFQTWGPLVDDQPCPERKGETFKQWKNQLRDLGYVVEHRELRACDYGAPTIRKRFFLIARCDGQPIRWPEPTHGQDLQPYLAAKDIIDFNIPCPSIFARKRPLAENTMRRIAKGMERYVLDHPNPFIVKVNHGYDAFRGQSIDDPLQTITGKNGYGLVTPFLAGVGGRMSQSPPRSVEKPYHTITAKADTVLVSPFFVQRYGERKGQEPRTRSPEEPLQTIVPTSNGGVLIAPWIVKHFGGMVGTEAENPFPTITARGTQNQLAVAHLVRHFGKSVGSDARDPVGTITAGGGGKTAITTSHLLKLRNNCYGADQRDPLPTITAGGLHIGEVRAFLLKYYGTAVGQDCRDPLHSVTSKARFGLVQLYGEDYVIADIGMRMLTPRELYRAQSFRDTYQIDLEYEGRPLTKTSQVRMCGNSVPPVMAEALVQANFNDNKNAAVA
ncbi:MAG: DNA cytosine methyltransferase [Pseudomonadota bacterium]